MGTCTQMQAKCPNVYVPVIPKKQKIHTISFFICIVYIVHLRIILNFFDLCILLTLSEFYCYAYAYTLSSHLFASSASPLALCVHSPTPSRPPALHLLPPSMHEFNSVPSPPPPPLSSPLSAPPPPLLLPHVRPRSTKVTTNLW